MSNNVQPPPSPAAAAASPAQPDRSPVIDVLNATDQLTTTALITAREPNSRLTRAAEGRQVPVISINIASPDCAEAFFAGRAPRCVNLQRAGSLAELREILEHCRDEPVSPAMLDLIGHSTHDHHLLRLGATPIDMLDHHVARFFGALAQSGLLPRLRIGAVRLLGCETALTDSGQRTLRMLAQTLRLPVFGTLNPLLKSHSNVNGFDPAFDHLLIEASELT